MAISSIVSTETTPATDSIILINGKKAVATKNLIVGFEITKSAFDLMWKRNQVEFTENKDWNWYNPLSLQIVSHKNSPHTTRIFWTTGVSKASTKFNSVKAKEFAQKMFDNYGSQLDGETKLVKTTQPNFSLPNSYEEALEALLLKVKAEKQLSLELETMKPKANYFDIVVNQNPENLSVVETTSRFLNQEKGIKISYMKVWDILRDEKWLIYQKRSISSQTKHPFPSQKAKDNNWLTTTEKSNKVVINKETGEEKEFLNTQILITPAGRLELLKLVQKFINNQSQNLM